MSKTPRVYVSSHIYKTPSGQFWDDRKGKRITDRRGRSVERNAPIQRETIKDRYRDEQGRLSLRNIKVNSDYRKKGAKHKGSPDNDDFVTTTAWADTMNEEVILENARKHLDKDLPDEDHWNLAYLGDED